MELDKFKDLLKNKNKDELVPTALLGVSVLCGILILLKVTGFYVSKARAENVVKRAVKQNMADPNNVKKQLASTTVISDELKKNNLFAPPLVKQHPVSEVSGIFGDEVFIKNKWYKVGDMIADAKIVAIGPTSVTISWNGKEQTFFPIQAKLADAQAGPRGRNTTTQNKEGEDNSNKGNGEGESESVTVRIEGGQRARAFGGRGGPGGEGFTAMRQRFENMSEEERQAFRDRMRERFNRDRGGGFGGRGGPGGRRGPGGR